LYTVLPDELDKARQPVQPAQDVRKIFVYMFSFVRRSK